MFQATVSGYQFPVIHEKLMTSPKTFDTYRTLLMDELDIHDVAGLVRYAIRMGLVKLDQ